MDQLQFLNAVKLIRHSVYNMCDRDRVACKNNVENDFLILSTMQHMSELSCLLSTYVSGLSIKPPDGA